MSLHKKEMCQFTWSLNRKHTLFLRLPVLCSLRTNFQNLTALGILSRRGLIYVPGLRSSRMYETPAERNNSLDAACEVGPHRSTIGITHT